MSQLVRRQSPRIISSHLYLNHSQQIPPGAASPRLHQLAGQITQNTPSLAKPPFITAATAKMSITSSSSTSQPAPWRDLFVQHINTMSSPEFSLSTIRKIRQNSPNASTFEAGQVIMSPRVRTCIYRGLWADMPLNDKNEADKNPGGLWSSDLPVFTTDVRMDKMVELFDLETEEGHSAGGKETDERVVGSGGGANVEAMFWAKEPMVQWRIRGRAWVLSPEDIKGNNNVEGSGEEGRRAVEAVRRRMMSVGGSDGEKGEGKEEWTFRREMTAHFGNLSPGMRGTWKNPPSGRPIELPLEDGRLKLGQKAGDLGEEDVARANFRVVVIVPEFVDRCDLSDPARGRRWFYTWLGGGDQVGKREARTPGGIVEGEWEKVEVWP